LCHIIEQKARVKEYYYREELEVIDCEEKRHCKEVKGETK
jgi:hypothetical protein